MSRYYIPKTKDIRILCCQYKMYIHDFFMAPPVRLTVRLSEVFM